MEEDLNRTEKDRHIPRMDGGTYDPDNVTERSPLAHAEIEGRIRTRDEELEEIKTMMDNRRKLIQVRNGFFNKMFAWRKGLDHENETMEFLEEDLKRYDKKIGQYGRQVEKLIKNCTFPIAEVGLNVPGVAGLTIATMLTYVDMDKAPNPSSLWSYAGLDQSAAARKSKTAPAGLMDRRRQRGHGFYCTGPETCSFCNDESGTLWNKEGIPMGWGGNQTLRTQLYASAESWMKATGKLSEKTGRRSKRSAYRDEYERTIAKLSVSEVVTRSRHTGKRGDYENAWKDAPKGHRHGAALRSMIKLFLFDWWHTSKLLRGEEPRLPYVIEKLGHKGFSHPSERGWVVNAE